MAFQQTLTGIRLSSVKISRQYSLKPFTVVACALLFSAVSFINVHTLVAYYFLKIVQILLFTLLGFFYTFFQAEHLKQKPGSKQELKFLTQLALPVCVALSIVYVIYDTSLLIMAASSSAAFVLPFYVTKCWLLFNKIPEKEYRIWIPEKRIENTASIFLDCFYLKINLAAKYYDLKNEAYEVYIPYYISLGNFFSRFIAEKNRTAKAIEDTDQLKKLYAWEFFLTDKYGLQSRRLDPNKNLVDNRIKHSSVIIAKRVQPVKLLTYQNIVNEAIQ